MFKNFAIAALTLALIASLVTILVLAIMLSDQRSHNARLESLSGSMLAIEGARETRHVTETNDANGIATADKYLTQLWSGVR